jgi:hypothetical protein
VTAVGQLCPSCGLCCNGVLFRDVELETGDNATRLRTLGLALARKGRKTFFQQPCACFDGQWCREYSERPARCRRFECGVLKRFQTGQLTEQAALTLISRARKHVDALRDVLQQLGDTNEHLPLTARYAQVASRPIELSDKQAVELRARLMTATHELMELLQREFLS